MSPPARLVSDLSVPECSNQTLVVGFGLVKGASLETSFNRILVVDDYEPFRRFVCAHWKLDRNCRSLARQSDGFQAVQKAEELQPDLILLDIGLPTLNGIEAAHRISRLVPAAKILFVSQETDADVVAAVLSNGAKGYVRKQNASSELPSAVEAVLQGDRFVSEGLISETNFWSSAQEKTPNLPPRHAASAAPSPSRRNSVSGTANSVKPQFIQTRSFG